MTSTSTILKRQDKITRWAKAQPLSSPLIFARWSYQYPGNSINEFKLVYGQVLNNEALKESIPDLDDLPLTELVYKFFSLSTEYGSVRDEGGTLKMETGYYALRSAYDMWRHVILIRPEVTLIEVMSAVYEIRDRLYGHYCITTHRSVFTNRETSWRLAEGFPVNNFHCREFGMMFSSWGKLTLPITD